MIGKAPAETHQLIKYDLFCGEITKKSVALQQEMRQADEEGKTMNGFVMKKAKKKRREEPEHDRGGVVALRIAASGLKSAEEFSLR